MTNPSTQNTRTGKTQAESSERPLDERPRDPNWLGVGTQDEDTLARADTDKTKPERQIGIPTD